MMREQRHGRPQRDAIGAFDDHGTASPPDGDLLQVRESLRVQPNGEASEAIERATAVVGDDEGGAS